MNKQNIAICGLRYGKTKHQVEQIKKYIEENSLTEIKITILDSESKQKLDKIKECVNINSELIYSSEEDSDISYVPSEPLLSIIGGE